MKKDQQDQAILLRKEGYSIKKIERALNVSRSSVSRWVRHIELTDAQKDALKENIRLNAWVSNAASRKKCQLRREHFKEIGNKKVQEDKDFAIICALYWGEGTKGSNYVRLANSDYKLIDLFCRWLINNNYGFKITIQYHLSNDFTYNEIKAWWLSKISLLKEEMFNKPSICVINRASQKKNVGKLPYGTANIAVSKSTNLFWTIIGGIEGLYESQRS